MFNFNSNTIQKWHSSSSKKDSYNRFILCKLRLCAKVLSMQFTTLIRKEREATQWGYILALKIHKHYIVQKKSKYPSGNQSIPDVQQLEADQTQSFVSIFQPVSGSNKPCW